MTSPTAPILDGIADFPRRTTTLGETWREMTDTKPMEVPKWLAVTASIMAIALPLIGYAFGAGGKSATLDAIGVQVSAMAIKVDAVNASVGEMRSHAEARDEQFKNLNARIDDLLAQQRLLADKVERLEMAK